MTPHILGVGYSHREYGITATAWKRYGIEFDYVDDIKQAAAMLSFKDYICVAICADVIPQEDLDELRKVRPVRFRYSSGISLVNREGRLEEVLPKSIRWLAQVI